MACDDATTDADCDVLQIGHHVDHVTDRGWVDGVVAAGDSDAVVPAQPDPQVVPYGRWDRRQGEHRGAVLLEQVHRPSPQHPHLPSCIRSQIVISQSSRSRRVPIAGLVEFNVLDISSALRSPRRAGSGRFERRESARSSWQGVLDCGFGGL